MTTATAPALDEATKYIALAEQIMLNRKPGESDEHKRKRNAAFDRWVKRVLEKYGPVASKDLLEAVERMGFTITTHVNHAKKACNAVSYRGDHQDNTRWMTCLDYQLPAGKQPAGAGAKYKGGVETEKAEPREANPIELVHAGLPDPPSPLMPKIELSAERTDTSPDKAITYVPTTNGNGVPSETSAAAMLLLESLGFKAPGAEAREALLRARAALDEAIAALA